MEIPGIADSARLGMTYERSRIEAASQNLAIANLAFSSKSEALTAAQQVNNRLFNVMVSAGIHVDQPQQAQVKVEYAPDNPSADGRGYVYYPKVDAVTEMATMVSALRAYEANVRSYNTLSEMNQAALKIGGQ